MSETKSSIRGWSGTVQIIPEMKKEPGLAEDDRLTLIEKRLLALESASANNDDTGKLRHQVLELNMDRDDLIADVKQMSAIKAKMQATISEQASQIMELLMRVGKAESSSTHWEGFAKGADQMRKELADTVADLREKLDVSESLRKSESECSAQWEADAKLGALVRGMPAGHVLCKNPDGTWYYQTYEGRFKGNSAEEALSATAVDEDRE